MGMPHAITERRDAERLPFLSRWAQPGASLTSQGGLANGMHSQAVSWVVVLICLPRAIWPTSTTQHQYLVASNRNSLCGQRTLDTMQKE